MTTETGPYSKQWRDAHLAYQYHYRYLKRWRPIHLLITLDQTILHLAYWFLIAALIVAIINSQWPLIATAAFSLLLLMGLRTWMAQRAAHAFKAQLPTAMLPFLELSLAWHSMWFRLRLFFADKIDFTSHKL